MKSMTKNDYIEYFDMLLDNHKFNTCSLFTGHSLSVDDKHGILNYIGLRAEVEFGKRVIFVSSVPTYPTESEMIDRYTDILSNIHEYSDCVFVAYLHGNYFGADNQWEDSIIKLLSYYKYPVFGFYNRQLLLVYE